MCCSHASDSQSASAAILNTRRSHILISAAPCGGLRSLAQPQKKKARSAPILLLLFFLHQMTHKHGENFDLYRDDGLSVSKATPREIEIIKKDVCSIFNNHGLKITIEANKKIVNFLDVTLNLSTQKYQPFTNPNKTPLYVHNKSNHPPKIIENIPAAINKRLSEISSDEDSFQHAVLLYQEALAKSGY